jgi:superfamily II DNA or RNA helicase
VARQAKLDSRRINLQVRGRVLPEDALRQSRAAAAILERLREQPGVVLADEVGMGKTFVALAVAASVAWSDRRRRPVVVMVPRGLAVKWQRDFDLFAKRCIRPEEDQKATRCTVAEDAAGLFAALDDMPRRRASLVLLTHGAFHRSLRDPWIRLALLKRALSAHSLRSQRRALPRFASGMLRIRSRRLDEDLLQRLLKAPSWRWRRLLERAGYEIDDDPIPRAIARVLETKPLDLTELRDELMRAPLRSSTFLDDRISRLGRALSDAFRGVWRQVLAHARFRCPLLILDEAHHLKNPATRLASLFVEDEADEDASLLQGALAGRFERLLFLTATPFQLGHRELLNVLDRFRGIAWSKGSPRMSLETFMERQAELGRALDDAQLAAANLDSKWGLLRPEDVGRDAIERSELDCLWSRARAGKVSERVQVVQRAYDLTHGRMREAEELLRPWVIRHRRSRALARTQVSRRRVLPGKSVDPANGEAAGGLPVAGQALLPFLLAARAEAVELHAGRGHEARLTFAEGLASSYEAFLQTKALRDSPDHVDEYALGNGPAEPPSPQLSWYVRRLRRALPGPAAYRLHPKIDPTVRRAVELWERGEKVLIFCHYRATGRALQAHISRAIGERLIHHAAERARHTPAWTLRRMQLISDRFDSGRPLELALREWLQGLLGRRLEEDERAQALEVIRRFVRTPGFLARYFPLGARDATKAFRKALEKPDGSGLSLGDKLEGFVRFLIDVCEPAEREEYLQALRRIHTGSWGAAGGPAKLAKRIQAVRLVNGETDLVDRRRLLLGFNTPFFPEVLVASSVMAEGVDLHRECRHIIHHDLSWNPSTLEQRTGRVDRIGAKCEVARKPIDVFLPYVSGTQDEKMYRVVRDRERWFQVVMGDEYSLEHTAGENGDQRLPLPAVAAEALALKLEVSSY